MYQLTDEDKAEVRTIPTSRLIALCNPEIFGEVCLTGEFLKSIKIDLDARINKDEFAALLTEMTLVIYAEIDRRIPIPGAT